LKEKKHFRGAGLYLQGSRISQARNEHEAELATCFMLISCFAYFSTLKLEAVCSSETSVDLSADYTALYSRR
jgi:hypothetical protein